VAIYRLDIQSLSRSAGRSAINAAAYRAGERIRDERTGRSYDHTRRDDVLSKEIVLPSTLAGSEPPWARDRAMLWNLAEAAEKRSNSRVAREYQVSLPSELSDRQRLDLSRAFSRELADRYNVAVDMTIHAPREGGDARAYHAHLLTTTREATSQGLGAKSSIELAHDPTRVQRGLLSFSEEYKAIRARWADLTNEALREAHIDARVDHRSLAAQGIDREPGPSIPHRFVAMERKGVRTTVGEQIRQNFRRHMDLRAARTAEASRGIESSRDIEPRRGRSPDEIRREAVQSWLQYRAEKQGSSAVEQPKEVSREKTHDQDYSL